MLKDHAPALHDSLPAKTAARLKEPPNNAARSAFKLKRRQTLCCYCHDNRSDSSRCYARAAFVMPVRARCGFSCSLS